MREFYVYEYIRLDTNEPIYIGKGKGSRWKDLRNGRSTHLKNIINKVGIACIILSDCLTEEESLEIECWYIWEYRDILGYNILNKTDGGEGVAGLSWNDKRKKKHAKTVEKAWNYERRKAMSRASKSRWENEETGQYKKPVTKGKTCYVYKDKELIKEFSSIAAMAIWYLENYSEFGYVKVYRDIKKHLKEGTEYGGFTFTTNKPINI